MEEPYDVWQDDIWHCDTQHNNINQNAANQKDTQQITVRISRMTFNRIK